MENWYTNHFALLVVGELILRYLFYTGFIIGIVYLAVKLRLLNKSVSQLNQTLRDLFDRWYN